MVTLRRPPQHRRSGPVLEAYQVLMRPLITEKATFAAERYNAYTFQVNPLASKTEIKQAVESLFEVKVVDVRTVNRAGKARRYKNRVGKTTGYKKAIVKLSDEHRIDFY
jgi:large subunit ribosomal protein L23